MRQLVTIPEKRMNQFIKESWSEIFQDLVIKTSLLEARALFNFSKLFKLRSPSVGFHEQDGSNMSLTEGVSQVQSYGRM